MKLKGRFEQNEIYVGLSGEFPFEVKLADVPTTMVEALGWPAPTHVKFVRKSLDFELTSDELVRTPERMRCYQLVSVMPEDALPEVEEGLRETYQHYHALAEAGRRARLIPESKVVKATVLSHVKT